MQLIFGLNLLQKRDKNDNDYKLGKRSADYVIKVKNAFPNAKIVDCGEVWKTFRGGSTVANSSHWFVKFTLPE